MAENNSFSDALQSVTQPAENAEHAKTMQALQSELDYHRKRDGNGTYLSSAVSYVYDGGSSDSLHKLELAYKNEQEHPNSLGREDVIKMVEDDQKAMRWQGASADTAVGLTAGALAYLGGAKGRLAAAALVALNTTHPNDSLGQQVAEGGIGFGLGLLAGDLGKKSLGMQNQWIGVSMAALAYPLAAQLGPSQWPNKGIGHSPDAEKIYNTELPKTAYSPYSGLQPLTTPEWGKFDFLKK